MTDDNLKGVKTKVPVRAEYAQEIPEDRATLPIHKDGVEQVKGMTKVLLAKGVKDVQFRAGELRIDPTKSLSEQLTSPDATWVSVLNQPESKVTVQLSMTAIDEDKSKAIGRLSQVLDLYKEVGLAAQMLALSKIPVAKERRRQLKPVVITLDELYDFRYPYRKDWDRPDTKSLKRMFAALKALKGNAVLLEISGVDDTTGKPTKLTTDLIQIGDITETDSLKDCTVTIHVGDWTVEAAQQYLDFTRKQLQMSTQKGGRVTYLTIELTKRLQLGDRSSEYKYTKERLCRELFTPEELQRKGRCLDQLRKVCNALMDNGTIGSYEELDNAIVFYRAKKPAPPRKQSDNSIEVTAEDFTGILKLLKDNHGLNNAGVASKLGVSKALISQLKRGHKPISQAVRDTIKSEFPAEYNAILAA